MLRFLTAGESHGKALIGILDGIPAGLNVSKAYIDNELKRRQAGYGRSERMEMEKDRVEILSGLRKNITIGSPISMLISNMAGEKWDSLPQLTALRPGHADLAGALKYGHRDIRNVLERSSARETAMRVALGAVAKLLCGELGIFILSQVNQVGKIKTIPLSELISRKIKGKLSLLQKESAVRDILFRIKERIDGSLLHCFDEGRGKRMKEEIDKARKKGDSLGGIFEIICIGAPPGLGSYVHWDRRLDGRLSRALMSIPAIKGVEIGLGFGFADMPGSSVHDEILYRNGSFTHRTNNSGGIEGGVTNSEPITLRAVMKPIPTLRKPLPSVDLLTKRKKKAAAERADTCAVASASIVGEAVVALEVAVALTEKFGGDTVGEMKSNLKAYLKTVEKF